MSRFVPLNEDKAPADEKQSDRRQRWLYACEMESRRWARWADECNYCGQRIGHLPECMMLTALSAGLPHEEVRPGCFTVRRNWIGDAIRAACVKRGAPEVAIGYPAPCMARTPPTAAQAARCYCPAVNEST